MEKTVAYQEREQRPAKLMVFQKGDMRPAEHLLGQRALLGREGEIKIHSPIVSRNHGEFICYGDVWYYRDLGSTNGTWINGTRYSPGDGKSGRRLTNGDVIKIDSRNNHTLHPYAVILLFLTIYPDNMSWQIQPLSNSIAEINIGRQPGNELSFSDGAISKNHATFLSGDTWSIQDHCSTNGVYVNNKLIQNIQALRSGDVIRIADIYFLYFGSTLLYSFTADATRQNNGLQIRITEKSVWQRLKRITILKDIYLTISPGELVMILGGSGAGKTTFMNAVIGYEKAKGQILHGNLDIYRAYSQVKYEIGFVPQQDLLRMHDDVYHTLLNAARMKLPRSMDETQRKEHVEKALAQMGLQREHDSLVSKLSGGQRKRLSIALELIAQPSLFFLDEPDSGLDGNMARNLHTILRQIANTGKIVMVITHSPDRVVDLYDKTIVLAKSVKDNTGHLTYYGTPCDAMSFFQTDSMEAIVQKLNRPDEGGMGMSDEFIEKYNAVMEGLV